MKKTYSISEVSKMLNITIDTIRFYEKKNMIHPTINPNNRYREYDLGNILEILDIIFYRNLDLSVSDMYSIMNENDEKMILSLLEKKSAETKIRIKYEQQLIKKLDYLCSVLKPAISNEFEVKRKKFEKSYILFEYDEFGKSASNTVVNNLPKITREEFVLGAVIKSYDKSMNEQKIFYTIEESILEDLSDGIDKEDFSSDNTFIEEFEALSIVSPLKNGKLDINAVNKIYEYADKNNIRLDNFIIAHEINTTTYSDKDHHYSEIYIKIKK
ncbi:MerR family transcriptional regulator [Peptacetobacter hominis]|uniref:MerR family transcriptional regulator n=1 Tax=Peptacetobacter hominis TaxID=2743610 RepID=A0A544QT93_9FIRM|nr:MerR family transcriptional regulator [Peptacetobacter hominis]TQQ83904.1 MerR family transcriptional regulator [Peptacetobacter hominis]